MKKYKVGVFDSGMGGQSVAKYIELHIPDVEVIFASDPEHLPYGDKSMDKVHGFVTPILKKLEEQGCQAIVVACNTVTTNLIEKLRQEIQVPLIGLEPMVKQAAKLTKSNVIAVCATPATLSSERYKWLVDAFAEETKIIEPDCSNWTRMIETSEVDQDFIGGQIKDACDNGADVIVLGCTHYHWIEKEILEMAEGRAIVLQPEEPATRQLKKVLSELKSVD